MKRTYVLILALFLGCSLMHAATLSFSLNSIFSPTIEEATPPYGTATFEDTSTSGQVKLTLTTTADPGSTWFISAWYFNLDPFPPLPSGLTITRTTVPSEYSAGLTAATITTTAPPPLNADGGGDFDLVFSYPESGSGRFTAGLHDTYYLYGTDLDALDFNKLSTGSGNSHNYLAAHVQSLSDGNSVFVTGTGDVTGGGDPSVPEPVTFVLVGMVLVAAGLTRRFRGRRSNNPAAHL